MVELISLEDVVVILAETLYGCSGEKEKQELILRIVEEISKIPTIKRRRDRYEIR